MRTAQDKNTIAARQTILRAFAEMKLDLLDLHVFLEASGNQPTAREHVVDAIDDLQREGLIASRGGDFYSLTAMGVEAARASR